MKVSLLKPIGYCNGVIHSINYAIKIKNRHPDKNVYVFGMLIHNKEIIRYLESYDIRTIKTENENEEQLLSSFSKDDVIIFTAHGHPKKHEEILNKNEVTFYDAVCEKVQQNIDIILNSNQDIIYIGKSGHKEAEVCKTLKGNVHFYDITNGFDFTKVLNKPIVINQTTLSFLELKEIHDNILNHYKDAIINNEICNATRVRQENIKNIPSDCDLVIVVGDRTSSNSNKLYEIAKSIHQDKTVLFVENVLELKNYNLNNYSYATITSGTSTPISLIKEIEEFLSNL